MKGQILVKSKVNQGSNFMFAFPAKVFNEIPGFKRVDEEEKEYIALTGRKCLILDDIPENSFVTKQILSRNGIQSICTQNGIEALNLYKQDPKINLIITDLRMPIMSGQAFIIEIRKFEIDTKRIQSRIIVFTAESSMEEKELCLTKYGANEYLIKPITQKTLIETLINCHKKMQNSSRKNILIIDDTIISCTIISKILMDEGHFCRICNSIKEVSKIRLYFLGNRCF